ncbi:MAG: hypothetical protein EOP51_20630 [Sphingobacteriales bacterium]|nr:MAG: hypothetical protein EOP51_20630 [Sphingobacteriales bacterium]
MKKIFLSALATFSLLISLAQNIGIGENSPTAAKLQVKGIDSSVVIVENGTNSGTNVRTGLFFKTGPSYAGSISTVGTGYTHRLGFFTYGGSSPSSLLERLSISDAGDVGIGVVTPAAKLDINGVIKISGGFPGAGKLLQSDANGMASWADKSTSFLPAGASGNTLRHNGSSYISTSNLYNNGSAVGIGTASPSYILDINGRMRLRHNGNTSGLWFNGSTNVENSFIGQYTDNLWGIFSGGAWKFAVNATDGTVLMGSSNLDNEVQTNAVGYKLKVFGKIIGEEVRVQLKTAWPDYVFGEKYQRLSIDELEQFVTKNKHLPNIPSAAEVEANGQLLGEMQRKMMEKIEELSLYIIDLKKEIDLLKKKNTL